MWNRIEEMLSVFKPLFSRAAAYAWYVVIIIGLMIRSDRLGLTSKDKPSEANLMIFLRSRIFSLLTIHARNEIPAFMARLQIDFSSNSA